MRESDYQVLEESIMSRQIVFRDSNRRIPPYWPPFFNGRPYRELRNIKRLLLWKKRALQLKESLSES